MWLTNLRCSSLSRQSFPLCSKTVFPKLYFQLWIIFPLWVDTLASRSIFMLDGWWRDSELWLAETSHQPFSFVDWTEITTRLIGTRGNFCFDYNVLSQNFWRVFFFFFLKFLVECEVHLQIPFSQLRCTKDISVPPLSAGARYKYHNLQRSVPSACVYFASQYCVPSSFLLTRFGSKMSTHSGKHDLENGYQ